MNRGAEAYALAKQIKYDSGARLLIITMTTAANAKLVRFIYAESPSADAGHGGDSRQRLWAKENVAIGWSVGNYAVRLVFDDDAIAGFHLANAV